MSNKLHDVRDWVQKWVNDIIKWDNINISLEKCEPLLKKCNLTRKFIGDIVVELGRNVFHESGAFILYQWEATLNHSRASIILALSGLYNPAFTLLRNSLELLIKGAFYEGLAHEKYREKMKWVISDFKSQDYCQENELRNDIINVLKIYPEKKKLVENYSSYILDLAGDRTLCFRNLVPQVIAWGFLYPIKDIRSKINRIYSELSENVHEYPSKTDFGRVIFEGKEFEFEQTFSENSLEEFIGYWLILYDIATVLSINIFRDKMEADTVKKLLYPIASRPEFKKLELPYTKELLKSLGIST